MQWTFRAEYLANRSSHSHNIASVWSRRSHLSSIGRGYPRLLFLPRWLLTVLTGYEYLPYEVVNSSTPGNVS